ncbi:hypothetical protein GCM10010429_31930 [Micromonospora olivasterospora]
MLGSPTVNISGSATRIESQSKNVSHRVLSGSIASFAPLARRPYGQEAAEADADGSVAAGADGTGTVPLPGLKSAGIGRPG